MLWPMLGRLAAVAALAAAPPTTEPEPTEITEDSVGRTLSDVVSDVWDNIGNNGYQTGVAVAATTVALVVMSNLKVNTWIRIPVAIGAFWAGWLAFNTFTGQDNPLFPTDPSATDLWDVAFSSDTGFLVVVIVACIAAVFLWKKGTPLIGRLWLIVGAIFGASFLFNLVEAVRDT